MKYFRWLKVGILVLLGVAAVIVTSLSGAFVAAFGYVSIIEFFDPLEPNEAAGPQFARGMIALLFALAGLFMGATISILAWVSINRRRSSDDNRGRALPRTGI